MLTCPVASSPAPQVAGVLADKQTRPLSCWEACRSLDHPRWGRGSLTGSFQAVNSEGQMWMEPGLGWECQLAHGFTLISTCCPLPRTALRHQHLRRTQPRPLEGLRQPRGPEGAQGIAGRTLFWVFTSTLFCNWVNSRCFSANPRTEICRLPATCSVCGSCCRRGEPGSRLALPQAGLLLVQDAQEELMAKDSRT